MSEPSRLRNLSYLIAVCVTVGVAHRPALAQEELGDPTRPTALAPVHGGSGGEGSGPRWRLQSTLVADTRRVAVINGHAVKAGERVDGATVVEVRTDGVLLDYEGQRMEIRLLQAGIKRRSG